MGRKKALEDRPAIIVEVAARLFEHYGLEQTTIEMIASEAGISKASIYLDFKNKQEILLAVIAAFAEKEYRVMLETVAQPEATVLKTLYKLLTQHFMAVYHHATPHHKANALFQAPDPLPFKPNIAKYRPDLIQKPIQLVATLLKQAAEQGEILAQREYFHVAQVIFMTLVRIASPPHPPHLGPLLIKNMIEDLTRMLLYSLKAERI